MLPDGQMPRSGSIANTRAAVNTMPPNTSAPIHGASRSGDTRSSHAIGTAQHALISAFATNSGIPSGANGLRREAGGGDQIGRMQQRERRFAEEQGGQEAGQERQDQFLHR